jgi:putative addiction module killer protein
MIEIRKYKTPEGKIPFDKWMSSLKDPQAAKQVMVRLRRLSLGLEGDRKPIGENVLELRIRRGKGYRVYYAWVDSAVVLLLAGGNKATQEKDIKTAKQYWRNYHG